MLYFPSVYYESLRREVALRPLTLLLMFVVVFFSAGPVTAQDAPDGGGPLAGRVIVLSPGHGLTFLEDCQCYSFQRAHQGAILEDILNAEIAMQLNAMLTGAGAVVYPARNLDPSAGTGESGHPLWHENARLHLKTLGLPEEIWNDADIALVSDIRARPLYANHLKADVFISIHHDIGGASGTSVLYDTNEHHAAGSLALGQHVHDALIGRLRADYNPDWVSRGVRGYNAYGEIRLADMPAIIIEVAFMDTPEPDYQALLDPQFKHLVALGIYEGVLEYFTGMPAPTSGQADEATQMPLKPGMLRAPVAVVVRSGPGLDYPQVDVLSAGQGAYIQDRAYDADVQADWLMIGEDRWVAGWIVETVGEATDSEPVSAGESPPTSTQTVLRPGELRAPVAVIVRSGPGMDYPKVGVLAEGKRARIVDRSYDAEVGDEWLSIGDDRWVAGWIVETASNGAAATESESAPTASDATEAPIAPGTLKATTAAIVRRGPGMDFPQVGVLAAGERAAIEGRSIDGFWLRIGEDRWVGMTVVAIVDDIEALPIVETPEP